ncbi:YisL family protein [Cytobacillus suaedae]|nr:YisL family protein [Cytobacillus suaedae]
MTHAHITAWVIALILFFVAVSMQKGAKSKSLKIVHMTLRLFYILIIVTGAILLIGLSSITLMYVLKVLAGIWVIGMLEMILVRGSKGKSTGMFWGQLVVALIVTIYLGLKLPIGFILF